MLCVKKAVAHISTQKIETEKRGGKEAKEKIRHTTERVDTKSYTCHFHPVPPSSTTAATPPPPPPTPTPITLFHGAHYVSRSPRCQRNGVCCPDHYEWSEDQLRGEKTPHHHHSRFCKHTFTTPTPSIANSMLQGTVCEKASHIRKSHSSKFTGMQLMLVIPVNSLNYPNCSQALILTNKTLYSQLL